jgi:phosphinothricin acetyltransferase
MSLIRPATESDLRAIVAIYNAAIPGRLATADTEAVTPATRRGWLLNRDTTRYPLWVFEREAKVVGWLSFGPFYGRPAYEITAEIGIYVDPAARRTGVATALMSQAVARAPEMGHRTLLGFIFAHNQPSLALFTAFGFAVWGDLPRVALLDGIEQSLLILGRRTVP